MTRDVKKDVYIKKFKAVPKTYHLMPMRFFYIKNHSLYNMGTFLSKPSIKEDISNVSNVDVIRTKIIIINQASCYKCNSVIKDRGICKCGNVEIYGGNEELGRRVKYMDKYSDCSLIEYRPIVLS